MPAKKKSTYVFAQSTTSVREPQNKYPTSIQQGSAWYADCPLVRAHPELFSSAPPVVYPQGWEPPVEQATAAPGEKRTTTRG